MKMDLIRAAAAAVTLAVVAVPAATNAAGGSIAVQNNRVIAIHNRTSTAIYYVYISMPDQGWGSDWLASDETITNEETRSFNVNDRYSAYPKQCIFDIKVKYSNDVEHTMMGANICTISHIDAQSNSLVVEY